MFIIWSSYWLWSVIDIHLRSQSPGGTSSSGRSSYLPLHTSTAASSAAGSGSSSKGAHAVSKGGSRRCCSSSYAVASGRGQPFRSRAWYPWPYWNAPALEPLFKLLLPLLGVLVELYIGWGGWRCAHFQQLVGLGGLALAARAASLTRILVALLPLLSLLLLLLLLSLSLSLLTSPPAHAGRCTRRTAISPSSMPTTGSTRSCMAAWRSAVQWTASAC